MYQSMSNYDQSSDFYQRQPCFMPNNSNIANLAPPLNQRFQDSHYRFNQPQMLTFYPNLNRSPGIYHHMPGIPPSRQYDDYSSGSCHYRLVNMREGYNAPKLPPRTKNIVKITNPETGDNIFNELEKERKLNIPTENRNENIPKVENDGSSQSSPNTLSSTNLVNQQSNGIPNSASEESASPKTFMNHGLPPGSCESNSLMTSSSASSRPPSVSLASSSQEMTSSSTAPSSSFFPGQQASGQSKSQHFNFTNSRNGPMDVSFSERPDFHDQGKSVYCNHLPMMIPTFGCRPPYVPPHLQQIPGPRFSGFYNLPHNFYDQPNYYYEGEAMHSFFPQGNPHGFHQNLSRFPALGHPAASVTQNSQSGSGSNSSEELNSECDLQFLSARLLDKALQNKGNKYSRHVSESKDEDKFKLEEDTPNEHNNTTDVQDVPLNASEKPALESSKSAEHDSNSCETSRDAKEITLDPNAKSFVYSGTLLESLKQVAGCSEVSIPGTTFDGNEQDSLLLIGHEMKRFSSRGSNIDHMDCDTIGRSKKNSMSTMSGSSDVEDNRSSSKMFRSGSEGGNLEKSSIVLPNGSPVSVERRNMDTNVGKTGRIQYSREFLLNLQYEPDSLKTPKGLTIFPEIILNGKGPEAHRRQFLGGECQHHVTPYMHPGITNNQSFTHAPSMSLPSVVHPNLVMPPRFPYHHTVMMMPPPATQQQINNTHHQQQPNPTVGRQVKGKSFNQQQAPQQPSRKVIQVCLGQNVQLHQSENAWKPMTLSGGKKEEMVDTDEVAIVDLYRKVRSILNKLTPQKFDTLIQQVHDLSIDTEEKLKGCIKLIFEKAIGEPSFSIAYAQMAKSLNNLKVHVDERPGETVTFRKLLLNQCQKEFEKDKLEELDLEKMSKQIEETTSDKEKQHLLEVKKEAEKIAKRRSLGNIRFIGELFKLKMLTEHIMFDCINRLLRYCGDEDNVECLCRLLVTIGKDLDNASPSSKQRLSQSFQELKQLLSKQQLSSRIRFMIQDVLELRENDWIPRREDTKPKLIEQIHKEAEMEELHKRQQLSIQHKCHHQNSSSSIPHELQRSSSLASSGLDHHRGSFDGRSQFPGHQSQHHYQGRGSIDRSLRQPVDRFGSLERVKVSDNFSGGGNGSSKLNLYATLGHTKRYSARPLTGGGSSISSSDLGRTLEILRNESANIQLAPLSYKQQLHKPWQEGSSGGIMRQGNDSGSSPLPPTALRSRGSASDIFGRSYARSPVRIAPRSRIFDPKALERDKHAAIAAAKSISSSVSADSFISSPVRASRSAKDSQLHEKSIRFSSNMISLSPRDLANQQKDLEKKCQSLLEEYLTADDLQEACLSFKEMHSTVKGDYTQMLVLTNYLVNNSLEKSNKDRQKVGVLLSHLVLKNLVSVDIYLESISSILKDAQDISIDIPKVWDYLAELVSRAILGKVFSFGNLSMLCLAIGSQDKQDEFISHVIKATTNSFASELNIADQPFFLSDLILFLSCTDSSGNGDSRTLNEEQLKMHSVLLRKCLANADVEWQVLLRLKADILGLVDVERAPAVLSSILKILQESEVFSNSTIAKWNNSSNGCK